MDSRERSLRALFLEEHDRVPTCELTMHLSPEAFQKIGGEVADSSGFLVSPRASGAPSGITREEAVEKRKSMLERAIKDLLLCYRHFKIDMFCYTYSTPDGYKEQLLSEDQVSWIDEWGVKYRYLSDTDASFVAGGGVAKPEDLESWVPPDPNAPGRMLSWEIIKREINEGEMALVGRVSGPSECYRTTGGLDKYVILMYRHPHVIRKVLDAQTDFSIEVGKSMIDMGADAINISDDCCSKTGSFIHPRLYREFIFPRLKKMVDAFKKKHVPVFVHCDGHTYPILDDLVSTGTDGIHSIEPSAGMDIRYVKEKYGDRICLFGNIDVTRTLPFGTPENVASEVKERIDMAAPGGGYVLSTANVITRIVPLTNIEAMYQTCRKYGKYPKEH